MNEILVVVVVAPLLDYHCHCSCRPTKLLLSLSLPLPLLKRSNLSFVASFEQPSARIRAGAGRPERPPPIPPRSLPLADLMMSSLIKLSRLLCRRDSRRSRRQAFLEKIQLMRLFVVGVEARQGGSGSESRGSKGLVRNRHKMRGEEGVCFLLLKVLESWKNVNLSYRRTASLRES